MRLKSRAFGAIRSLVAAFVAVGIVPWATPVNAAPLWQSIQGTPGSTHSDAAGRVIANLGVGHRVDVGLRRGERIAGEIREIRDDSFILTLDGAGASAKVAYRDVRQVVPAVLHQAGRWRTTRIRRAVLDVAAAALAVTIAIHECSGKSC
jgi:hypothetical protein